MVVVDIVAVRRTLDEANIFRQIKCNNEQPTCANCRTYGKDCVYEPLVAESTPTPRRAERQRQGTRQNRQRTDLGTTPSRIPEDISGNDSAAEHGGDTPQPHTPDGPDPAIHSPPPPPHSSTQQPGALTEQNPSHRAGVSRIVVSANGVSSYHGRTSALFEESLQERSSAVDLRPRMPDEWIEKGLVAEAARQRMILLLHQKLGFGWISRRLSRDRTDRAKQASSKTSTIARERSTSMVWTRN